MNGSELYILIFVLIVLLAFAIALWYKFKAKNAPVTDRLISPEEKERQIHKSMQRMLLSPDLNDVQYAEILIEGMCNQDPQWLYKLLGDVRRSTTVLPWLNKAPHRQHIIDWARSHQKSLEQEKNQEN